MGRLLFAGLWTIADRSGRLEDRPKRIKAEVLPYDECDVNALLDALDRRKFIIRYVVDDDAFIQIAGWDKHQNPHKAEAKSVIPECPKEEIARLTEKSCTSTIQEQFFNSSNRADSFNLIPDSLSLDSFNLIPDSFQNLSSPDEPVTVVVEPISRFSEFWAIYPKKVDKKKAETAFNRILKRDIPKVLDDVRQRASSPEWTKENGKYIPNATTYIHGERWNDQGTVVKTVKDSFKESAESGAIAAVRAKLEAKNNGI